MSYYYINIHAILLLHILHKSGKDIITNFVHSVIKSMKEKNNSKHIANKKIYIKKLKLKKTNNLMQLDKCF